MVDPAEAQIEVYEALRAHFDRTDEGVNVEQITEMTALDEDAVKNALRGLQQQHRINGVMIAEATYPILVTSINYDV